MKNPLYSLLIPCLAASAAMAQVHPSYTREGATFTPSNLFTPPALNAALPLTGGMDVFPDGRVALVEWGIPGSVFIFSGLDKGSSGIKVTRFATGLDNAMGLKIVDNVIYVMEKEALTQLLDTDSDGVADQYNSINEAFPSDNGMLNFAYDLGYLNGSFYAALSSDVHIGGPDWGSPEYGGSALPGRSTLYKLNKDGTSSAYACGFRNPNGMWTNGEDLFVTDNQGTWLPSSKVINVKAGKFYGHQTNPANACQTANNNAETPPLAWSNYADGTDATGRSWGNGAVLSQGTYAGQMLVGETVQDHANKIVRVFTENVGGDLQGCVIPFVKSGIDGVFRIKEGPAGRIYLGLAGSSGSWNGRAAMVSGFDVLAPNGKLAFDVLAVRNRSNNSFDIEFTKPAGASAAVAANYKARIWQNIPASGYGAGNMSNATNLTVSSAVLSADKLHATLTLSGLQTGRVVKINFSNITADDGTALFANFALYTLNKFGPGTDYKFQPTTGVASKAPEAAWRMISGKDGNILRFLGDASAPKDIAVYDLRGAKRLEMRGVMGSEVRLNTSTLSRGMYMVRVNVAQKASSGALLIP
ncbi:MAG: hypothetical protein JF616_06085 [Fibrobacteres bacterium]|nr:hypothetical protein [Fibrobacterota bacterium]